MLSKFVLFSLLTALATQGAPIAEPAAEAALYQQCGGINWTGATECPSSATCTSQNPYYYQCVETGTAVTVATSTKDATASAVERTPTSATASAVARTSTSATTFTEVTAAVTSVAFVEDNKKTTSSTKNTSTKKTNTKTTTKSTNKSTKTSSAEKATDTSDSSKSTSSSGSSSASCTVTTSNFSDLDTIKSSCTSITIDGVTVPAGETLDLTDLQDGTTVTFSGTTSFAYKEWEGPLISVSGSGVTVTGASGHSIDGNGAEWWDGEGSNGGKTKPKFFAAHKMIGGSKITDLSIKNTPVQCFSINGASDLTIDGVNIDNSDGDVTDGGHNTDAFDVGSSDSVTIQNCVVKNQDDCLAVNSGTNINFLSNTCSGGHGISIGSVGGRSNNVVENVNVKDCTVSDSDNGIRIKTVYGATGSVSGVTYSGIKLSGINKYGIVIEGDYENGSPTGTATSGVPITDLTVSDVTGSVNSDAQAVYILVEGASDWAFSDINITGGDSSKTCSGIPSGAGVSC